MGPMATDNSHPFWGYPKPLRGPDFPYKPKRKSNPAMRGWVLMPATHVMERVRPVREIVWQNAGFASLRKLRHDIESYEPLCDPMVVPLDHRLLIPASSTPHENGNGNGNGHLDAYINGNGVTACSDTLESTDAMSSMSSPSTPGKPFSLTGYYSASTYRNLYLTGQLTPTDVAKAILPLIRRDIEPKGSHYLYFFDSKVDLVLKAAEESTQRYRENCPLSPLDGVPCGIKDEYDLDGYRCTLGSLNDYTAEIEEDNDSITSWCVKKLEAAGVIIVGKTSMHEFGLDTTGNNPHYGTPRNPFNPDFYTGGSSSGTGGAVGAGLIPIGLGSDGGGSIRIPSSYCNIFGLKPTHARVSFWPSANHSNTCAVNGPMAADMESLATLFEVIAEPHPASPFAFPSVPRLPPAPKMLELDPARPKVLGICRAWFDDCAPEVRQLCQEMVDEMVEKEGYKIVDVEIPFLHEGQLAHAMTVLTDASTLLPKYDNLTWANRILLSLGRTTPATDYLLAQKLRRCLCQHMAHLWTKYPGMLLVTPTTACAGWRIHDSGSGRPGGELRLGLSDGDKTLESMRYVWMANFLGLPSISVPAGYVDQPSSSYSAGGRGQRRRNSGGGSEGISNLYKNLKTKHQQSKKNKQENDYDHDEDDDGKNSKSGDNKKAKIPVGLMATGEWAGEKGLVEFGVAAERLGLRWRERPAGWVDVVGLAREERE